jgi:hypothetical protein
MAARIPWREDFGSALGDAQREHEHILLDFHNPL